MTDKLKKQIILNLPYLIFVYLFDKLCQGIRLAPGADASEKLAPHRAGLFGGLCQPGAQLPSGGPVHGRRRRGADPAGGLLQRQEREEIPPGDRVRERPLGHPPADIAPYADPDFFQNVLLTQTERITVSSRPKEPKYARNKNILVIGGSGSGKTRFFVKPNLLQCHSSYVVTDPNGNLQ